MATRPVEKSDPAKFLLNQISPPRGSSFGGSAVATIPGKKTPCSSVIVLIPSLIVPTVSSPSATSIKFTLIYFSISLKAARMSSCCCLLKETGVIFPTSS